jgi:hypothetical protein
MKFGYSDSYTDRAPEGGSRERKGGREGGREEIDHSDKKIRDHCQFREIKNDL